MAQLTTQDINAAQLDLPTKNALRALLEGNSMAVEAGTGITAGVGAIYRSGVERVGGIIRSSILVGLTGLASSTTDLDIIGVGTTPAHVGQITVARNGTVFSGRMTCLEVPVTGVTDIDLYAATEGTGIFDGAIASLVETALQGLTGAWTLGLAKVLTAMPAADKYMYLVCGAAGVPATYTAGKFLIELEGYAP